MGQINNTVALWAWVLNQLRDRQDQNKVSFITDKIDIGVCHTHTQAGGLPNFGLQG